MSTAAVTRRPSAAAWAAGWSFVFAALSFVLALAAVVGVPLAAAPFGRAIAEEVQRRDVGLITIVWLSGDLKAGCGLVALGLMSARRPRPLLRLAAWAIGAGLAVYGLYNVIAPALMLAGVIAIPEALGETAAWWHLVLWGPWWLTGGALFLVAAAAQRPGPVRRSSPM